MLVSWVATQRGVCADDQHIKHLGGTLLLVAPCSAFGGLDIALN